MLGKESPRQEAAGETHFLGFMPPAPLQQRCSKEPAINPGKTDVSQTHYLSLPRVRGHIINFLPTLPCRSAVRLQACFRNGKSIPLYPWKSIGNLVAKLTLNIKALKPQACSGLGLVFRGMCPEETPSWSRTGVLARVGSTAGTRQAKPCVRDTANNSGETPAGPGYVLSLLSPPPWRPISSTSLCQRGEGPLREGRSLTSFPSRVRLRMGTTAWPLV